MVSLGVDKKRLLRRSEPKKHLTEPELTVSVATDEPANDAPRWNFDAKWLFALVVMGAAFALTARNGLWLMLFLGIVIVTHEAGHFWAARATGMRPTEFFWGFGPEIFSVQVGDCRIGIKAIFLGGYVKIEGMTKTSEVPESFNEAHTYRAANHRSRLVTILAGPATNLLTALAAFCVAAWLSGSGFVGGFEGSWNLFSYIVEGTGEALWLLVTNLGDYFNAVVDSSGETEAPVRFISPVGQAVASGEAASGGLAISLIWFGILATAVGIINLLPMPPLDGSHALIAFAEGAIQRIQVGWAKFSAARRNTDTSAPGRLVELDVKRLVPVAYLTVIALVLLSVSAVVLDVRDLLNAA